MPQKTIPMIGRVFGKLKVISDAGRDHNGLPRFNCECLECGEKVVRIGAALRYAVSRGQEPHCGAHRRRPGSVERGSVKSDRRQHGKVTVGNYREMAEGFTQEQVKRLAVILRRHDRDECYSCSRRQACHLVAEAVEMVLLEAKVEPDVAPDDGRYWSLDYRRQQMYV